MQQILRDCISIPQPSKTRRQPTYDFAAAARPVNLLINSVSAGS
jgi:hypothetical protein